MLYLTSCFISLLHLKVSLDVMSGTGIYICHIELILVAW